MKFIATIRVSNLETRSYNGSVCAINFFEASYFFYSFFFYYFPIHVVESIFHDFVQVARAPAARRIWSRLSIVWRVLCRINTKVVRESIWMFTGNSYEYIVRAIDVNAMAKRDYCDCIGNVWKKFRNVYRYFQYEYYISQRSFKCLNNHRLSVALFKALFNSIGNINEISTSAMFFYDKCSNTSASHRKYAN